MTVMTAGAAVPVLVAGAGIGLASGTYLLGRRLENYMLSMLLDDTVPQLLRL